MNFKEIKNGVIVSINGEGIYSIVKFKSGSRSVAIVEDIEKGEGWDEKSKEYKGIRYYNKDGEQTGWNLGANLNFGKRHEVNISKLQPLNVSDLPKLKRDDFGYAIAICYKLQYQSP